MSLHDYRFRDLWQLAAPAEQVYGAVVDLEEYPRWWRDVRTVWQVDEDTAELVCRAMLPYQLVIRMRRVEEDPVGGRVRVDLSGDLEGSLAGVVRSHEGGTQLEITQQVVARKRLLRSLAPLARPAFRLNHAAMMWRGERGLRAHLATSA
jgi:hypothetical protein